MYLNDFYSTLVPMSFVLWNLVYIRIMMVTIKVESIAHIASHSNEQMKEIEEGRWREDVVFVLVHELM